MKNKMGKLQKALLVTLVLLSCGCGAVAQYVPLVDQKLYFDLDKVWNYNLYERSRWGGGLKYTPVKTVDITAYVGYGVRDEQWKGGAGVAWRLPWSHRQGTIYLNVGRDYHAAASRRMQHSNITDLSGLSGFMSQLMDDRRGLELGYSFDTRRSTYIVEGRVFKGFKLYDDYRAIYLVDGDTPSRSDGMEFSLTMHRRSGFSAELLYAPRHAKRLLLQYDRRFALGPLDLYTYAQAGICDNYADFYYRFDLGGTYGSPLWFRNSMLTLRPYEYVANRFALTSLRLQTRKPLFSLWSKTFAVGTNPCPMVGASGVYGAKYYDEPLHGADRTMAAVEVMAGVNGLIRWGVVDYGVTFAWRVPLVDGETGKLATFVSAEMKL